MLGASWIYVARLETPCASRSTLVVFEREKNMTLLPHDFRSADIGVGVCVFWLIRIAMIEKEATLKAVALCGF